MLGPRLSDRPARVAKGQRNVAPWECRCTVRGMSAQRRGVETRLDALLYLAAALSYVGLGLYHKWLLNWIVGPLWLIAWLQIVPALAGLIARRGRAWPERPDPLGQERRA